MVLTPTWFRISIERVVPKSPVAVLAGARPVHKRNSVVCPRSICRWDSTVCLYVSMYEYCMQICKHIHLYTCIYIYIYIHICVCARMCACVWTYTHMYTYLYSAVYDHIHTSYLYIVLTEIGTTSPTYQSWTSTIQYKNRSFQRSFRIFESQKQGKDQVELVR